MKSLVICFVTVLMLAKPLWPIAEYIAYYDYIANVLCENKDRPQLQCNGKCYLAKQLAKESKEQQENPFDKMAKTELPQMLCALKDYLPKEISPVSTNSRTPISYKTVHHNRLMVFEIVHPPEIQKLS